MSNWISSGTGGIPTTDNIPETTEIFGFPTDNILDNRFFETLNSINSIKVNLFYLKWIWQKIGCPPEFFFCLGYIVSCDPILYKRSIVAFFQWHRHDKKKVSKYIIKGIRKQKIKIVILKLFVFQLLFMISTLQLVNPFSSV